MFNFVTFKNYNILNNLKNNNYGCLVLGGMPIGNNDDLSFRMLKAIPYFDVIVAENIEIFIELCKNYKIEHTKNMILLRYDGSHTDTLSKILKHIKNNKKILMVSDCGMPAISDPGREIVQLAIENNMPISSLPGPNVAITALALSSFPSENFHYYGYLPKQTQEKYNLLTSSKNLYSAVIFLESKTRILETIKLIKNIFGQESLIFIGVNITMENEMLIYGNCDYVYQQIKEILTKYSSIWIVCCVHNTPFNPEPPTYWTSIE